MSTATPATTMRTPDRARGFAWPRLAVWAVGFAALFVLGNALLGWIGWSSHPFAGYAAWEDETVQALGPLTNGSWPAMAAGLRPGDTIAAIDGDSVVRGQVSSAAAQASFDEARAITLAFSMPASQMEIAPCEAGLDGFCTITVFPAPLPAGDAIAYFWLPFVLALVMVGLGAALLAWVRGDGLVVGLASLMAFLTAIVLAGSFAWRFGTAGAPLAPWLSDIIWITGAASLAGAWIAFIMAAPRPLWRLAIDRRWVALPLLAGPVAGALIVLANMGNALRSALTNDLVMLVLTIAMALFIGIVIWVQRPYATSAVARDQSNALLGAALVALLALGFWWLNALSGTVANVYVLSFTALAPLLVTMPIAAGYVASQARTVDTDRVASQSITYAVLLIAIVLGYALLVFGFAILTQDILQPTSPVVVAIMIFLIAIGFLPVRNAIQDRVDAIYYRKRYNFQRMAEQFSQELARADAHAALMIVARDEIQRALQPAHVVFFDLDRDAGEYIANPDTSTIATDVAFAADGATAVATNAMHEGVRVVTAGAPLPVDLLADRARHQVLGTRALMAIGEPGAIRTIVVLGSPASGAREYGYEDLRYLETITRLLTQASQRTSTLRTLEQRVQELNVLGQISQALNYTIETDDLLELLSAQTQRLIDAPCFYIIGYSENRDLLSYTFLLENDERLTDRERQAWPLRNDPASDIVRSRQGVVLADFSAEMALRDVPILHESPDLKAWMGMPLNAGRAMLGVIAVAHMDPGRRFGEADIQSLRNIAELAATSLNKAQLFDETMTRARQLEALNTISRQLVASELDPDSLVQTIMAAAVEILDAEAGSLFMATEDNSGDMEFVVVVGGGGEELIGQRLPAGQGIVGMVAMDGQPRIVNDARTDPKHVDVDEDFVTQSLLAVPLVVGDRVLGVIEVLNKRDRSSFDEEELRLLSTFAGQAAVAIENARLFRMTDIQLAARLRELETLSHIDTELNRTLDVNRVGTITIEAAVANCNAQAGLLALVDREARTLTPIAMTGYQDVPLPGPLQADQWPMDYGVFRRIMRNRRPDLMSDTTIDPEYAPILPGAISQIAVPLMAGEDVNAILLLESNEAPPFTLADWSFAQRIAEHASIAVANAQLYDAVAMANKAKSDFMGFAAHELKNPLTPVIGFADILARTSAGALSEQQRKAIDIIGANARRMQIIIQDLRDSARLDAGEFQVHPAAIGFDRIVEETQRSLQPALEARQQTLRNTIPDELPLVLGDEERLIQLMTNLVSNANKYSPPATTITLSARQVIDQGQPMMQFSVRDEGFGMSEEDLSHLFVQRYFRSQNPLIREQTGTGLGMMIAQGIVERHKGRIWAESQPDEGSTFHFTLPLALDPAPAAG
jgi:signal transduction histidine kinase